MAKVLTLSSGSVTRPLHEAGFEREPAVGGQLILHHQEQDAWVALPQDARIACLLPST